LLILEKHEAHAEKDVVITAGGARPELFHGLMIDVDVVFHPVMTDQVAALAKIVTVDVDSIDGQHLIPYDRVKIGDHGAVADADIEDNGLRGEIIQTVIVTVGGGILDEKAIKAIAQSFHHFFQYIERIYPRLDEKKYIKDLLKTAGINSIRT
jgi:hypothetical protein